MNLGIVAHVDAGKTTLTDRLLQVAGVIDEIGSVDEGSTQTDTLMLERRRGITIKSAVVSFTIDDVVVNLIDTPGHPDFIAEVERVLTVLDGAVLVVAAVEGVQPQTRLLMRALRRLGIPTLVFVNKIDRSGARPDEVLAEIGEWLTPAVIPMGAVSSPATRTAGFRGYGGEDAGFVEQLLDRLAAGDDTLLAAYVSDEASVSYARLRCALAVQTGRGLVHPVYFGSAVTGAGVPELASGIAELLAKAGGDSDGPVSGAVFKIERGAAGQKVAFVRMFSGTVRVRDRLRFGQGREAKVTAIEVFELGPAVPSDAVGAGQIGKLWGLHDVRVGDSVGEGGTAAPEHLQFAPPTLETVVLPRREEDRPALQAALAQLAEQDPLINLRQDDRRREIFLSLYGEVQKEVIEATLADDFGLEIAFRQTVTICVEQPVGVGTAAEFMSRPGNPFRATVGLRLEPAAQGTDVVFGLGIEPGSLPVAFVKAVEEAARRTLRQGLHGWPVIDCAVTITDADYTPSPPTGWSKWSSSAGDFRHLSPLVVMEALRKAGTRVLEPMHHFELEVPPETAAAVSKALAVLRGVIHARSTRGPAYLLEGEIPAAQVHELRRLLPALTRGEGVLESAFQRYLPVVGAAPSRPRTDENPLHRREYLLRVARRG